jgi:NitT/TauT family transport system substrate-binding protein
MRRPFTALLTATAVLLTAACGSSSNSPAAGVSSGGAPAAPDKVNVGVIAIVDVAPIYLGK